jgi:hypothetical protein
MGRFSLFVGYYGVQGRGGANDAEGWSSIDEGGGRKEGGKRTGGGGELIAGRSKRDDEQCRWETEKDGRGSDREL